MILASLYCRLPLLPRLSDPSTGIIIFDNQVLSRPHHIPPADVYAHVKTVSVLTISLLESSICRLLVLLQAWRGKRVVLVI
jgi:hypothetical protein